MGETVELMVAVSAPHPADELRDLHGWLNAEPELRGSITPIEEGADAERLGPVLDGLQIASGAGGLLATMATILVAWLGSRKGEVSVTVTRGPEQTQIQLTAKGIRGLDLDASQALTDRIVETLRGVEASDGPT
jgi:hypothetical protein